MASRLLALLLGLPCAPALRTPHPQYPPPFRHYPGIGGEVCVVDVPRAHSAIPCKFISQDQGLCKRGLPGNLTGGHRKCMEKKRSCAVVGSSSHLLTTDFGSAIDAHEAVFRINGAPAGGAFARHVGSRTDYRFSNTQGAFPAEEKSKGMCVFLHEPAVPCGRNCWKGHDWCNIRCSDHKEGSFFWKACAQTCDLKKMVCMGAEQREEAPFGDNYVFMDLVSSIAARQMVYKPTAGLVALSFALAHCQQISVYGFGPACDGQEGARYDGDARVAHWHSYSDELGLLRRAAVEGPTALLNNRSWVYAQEIAVHLPDCVDAQKAP